MHYLVFEGVPTHNASYTYIENKQHNKTKDEEKRKKQANKQEKQNKQSLYIDKINNRTIWRYKEKNQTENCFYTKLQNSFHFILFLCHSVCRITVITSLPSTPQ